MDKPRLGYRAAKYTRFMSQKRNTKASDSLFKRLAYSPWEGKTQFKSLSPGSFMYYLLENYHMEKKIWCINHCEKYKVLWKKPCYIQFCFTLGFLGFFKEGRICDCSLDWRCRMAWRQCWQCTWSPLILYFKDSYPLDRHCLGFIKSYINRRFQWPKHRITLSESDLLEVI